MTETFYLVDNNALIALRRWQRASLFFKNHCRIPTDVLYEARFLPDHGTLETCEYPVTPGVLEHVQAIMQRVETGSVDLVDLYKNKGAADPAIIATALDAADRNEGSLFLYTWKIVTGDKAVRELADAHNIATMPPSELASLIVADSAGQ